MAIKNVGMDGLVYAIIATEAVAAVTAGEVALGTGNPAESLALTEAWSEVAEFVYSATAEGRGGEVADTATAIDLDDEPGLIYSGPTGRTYRVAFYDIDISEGTLAPEATDTATIGLMLNNKVIALSEEGYTALTGEVIHEHNIASDFTYVTLTTADVIRLAVIGDGAETNDVDVAVGGTVAIMG